ncbi:MAG: hypothetical protein RLZZ50_1753 [Verrucomicrobiota bacterium]|jgi:hypothetical protein
MKIASFSNHIPCGHREMAGRVLRESGPIAPGDRYCLPRCSVIDAIRDSLVMPLAECIQTLTTDFTDEHGWIGLYL